MTGVKGPQGHGYATAVERLLDDGSAVGLPDAELLDRFVGRRDEAAFAALVDRHGPMVLGVCRRLIRDPHDADDAFQAVFLILARKAGGIGRKELVGNWLYGVSRRVATRARVLAARRAKSDGLFDPDARRVPGPADSLAHDELGARLHEEVGRLPERYRAPVVACYFEGKSCEEAAALLRCPVGTVKGRLARARDLLRRRLERRGVTAPAAALATALAAPDLRAAISPVLVAQAARAGLVASSPSAWLTAAVASSASRSLAEGVIRAMFYSKLRSLALPAGLVVAGLLAAGAGLAAPQQGAPNPPAETPKASEEASQATASPPQAAPGRPSPPRSGVPGVMGGGGMGVGGGMMGGGGRSPNVEVPSMGPISAPLAIARHAAFLEAEVGGGEANAPIYEALDRKVSFRLGEDATLTDFLKGVRAVEVAGGKRLPVFVSRSGLAEAEAAMDRPVELELDDVPLKAALRLVLKDLGLAYCVRDGVVIISSFEEIRIELNEAIFELLGRSPGTYELGPQGSVIKFE